jgi:HK97 gp10 family phage protein
MGDDTGVMITIEGVGELVELLQGLAEEGLQRAREELQMTGLEMESTAKELAAVDTGRMRSSIRSISALDANGMEVTIFTDVEYAPYQEFGTRKMPAHPFMVPAAEQHAQGLHDRLTEIIAEEVAKVSN